MKKTVAILTIVLLVLFMVGCENSINPTQPQTQSNSEGMSLAKPGDGCATIKDGTIVDSKGNPISMGYDEWGYNYQSHMFNGDYGNYSRPDVLVETGIKLMMKWSDTWLANTDCNGDGKLDRGYDCDPINANSSGCPGAWLTNHMSGTDILADGTEYKWTYFTKIITPSTANEDYKLGGIWYDVNDVEIGPVIWGAFATVQTVSNDKFYDERGILYKSLVNPGFGYWNP